MAKRVEILTSSGCQRFEQTIKTIQRLIENMRGKVRDIEIRVVDLAANPEAALRYMIMTTPAVVIDGKLAFVGVPKEE
ncbi:MAG: thioredoxin family protein [Aigarchaeota archaeon]|nr:thioredoxin family protein [Candidatus Pelearchaeum maunauluense]